MKRREMNSGGLLALFLLASFQVTHQEDLFINCDISDSKMNIEECRAELDHTPLSCNKQGFFINHFSRHRSWAKSKSGVAHRLPLSQAVCCRPELPEIPELQEFLPADIFPAAVLSVGCHVAVNEAQSNMACEESGNSFVTGFVETFRPSDTDASFVAPTRGVICCTPVLLMSSGDVWELKRCNCGKTQSSENECDDGKLLKGFHKAEYFGQRAVPAGSTECCDLCLGRYLYDTSQCDHLKSCNGHGVCIMGTCECYPDWVGEKCDEPKEDYFADPQFESSIWWLGGLGFIGAFFCLFATFWIIRRTEQESPRSTNDRGLLGLISSYINDAGSVGTTDTESARSATDDEGHHTSFDEAREPKRNHTDNEAFRPLLQISCCLCEERPVQVTLIPCGHSNLCRKCSRKLITCPFCRKTIVRRQRLFLSV